MSQIMNDYNFVLNCKLTNNLISLSQNSTSGIWRNDAARWMVKYIKNNVVLV